MTSRKAPSARGERSGLAMLALLPGAVAMSLPIAALVSDRAPWLEGWASFQPLAIIFGLAALILALKSRSRFATLFVAGALMLSTGLMAREWLAATPMPDPDAGGERIVVVIHNVARANVDPVATRNLLIESGADILLLQEFGGTMRSQIEPLARRFSWHSKCPSGCDQAIFSRLPMSKVKWRFRDTAGRMIGPQLLWADVYPDAPGRFRVASLHLPWPVPDESQAAARRALIDAVATMSPADTERMIVGGDFNLTPWGASMGRLDDALMPLRRVTRAQWSYPARIDGTSWPLPFLPIDHLFAGPGWEVEEVEPLSRSGSDHVPLRIVLRRSGD